MFLDTSHSYHSTESGGVADRWRPQNRLGMCHHHGVRPMRRARSANRGSERRLSNSGLTFK